MGDCDRTRSVLHHVGPTPLGTGETFSTDTTDDPEARRSLVVIDPDVWTDLGTPSVVTVTVEPGDLLNELPEGYEPVLDTASTAQLLAELGERLVDQGVPGLAESHVEPMCAALSDPQLAYRPALTPTT